ncbi:MAG: ribbon-helix-helix domain-containing protein [Lachnospiraceae bacterium]|nr:ribbon-helix-helix domain-containing protein [Lachnospiraceae bacterium]
MHTNNISMDITLQKKAQSFRLPIDLIEKLKKMARKQNRSLNNFVECALLDLVYSEPNEETLAAIEEARAGKLQGPLDVTSVEAMYKSMGL